MAVYRQRYKPYDDRLTAPTWRFWILARFGFKEVFAWRMVLVFFVLSFVPILGGGSMIYLSHNLDTLLALDFPIQGFISIDAAFFGTLMGIQSFLAFFLAAFVGPGLVSPDLTNGALPLYLSRPFSRVEYTLGKFSVHAALISLITWVPGLFLFIMQGSLAGNGWFGQNLRLAGGIFVGSWAWILTVSLMAIALSAWVRWRPVAGGLLFGIFFAAAGFGGIFNEILRTDLGVMLNLTQVMAGLWQWLFVGSITPNVYPLPLWTAWLSLMIVWAISLWLLSRKVRAYEVVR